MTVLPTDKQARKDTPICTGLLDYFASAVAEVARVSLAGNKQHNGENAPLHWARGKSVDHADCIVRHLMERGTTDDDGMRHSAKMAWRALALLQEELEAEGAPMARGGK
jgi:dATP/dGTP diphosphohydrolase